MKHHLKTIYGKMKILRTCVIDDEPLAAQLIAKYVERTPVLELTGVFVSAQEAIKSVLSGNVDLIFLDIDMPQINGLEFARILPPDCRVVFTTAYEKFAVSGFKVNAVDYLLKPVAYEEFLGAAMKAVNTYVPAADNASADRSIIVKSEYRLVQIPLRSILYLEGLKDYVKICLEGDQKSVMTLLNLRTLEHELPAGMFMRVHRSFIVNTSKIQVIERNRILIGNNQIPISDSYKKEFNDYVNARLVGASRTE